MVGLLLGLLAGLLLAGIAIGSYWLGTRQSDETATSGEVESQAVADAEDTTTDGGAAGEGGDAEDPAAPATDSDDGTATTLEVDASDDPAPTAGAADGQLLLPDGFVPSDPNYESRIQGAAEYAVVRGGKVYLYGFSTTQEDLDRSIAITEGVMGPDGYVVERFVDPDAPQGVGAPIYVDDKVLFAFNSTELEAASLPILDLGTALMLQNPTAKMLIIARTDAVGGEEANLEISQRRGQAVVDYWASAGVEPSRMTIEARGEADASESDSEEAAALNRSVEFVVSEIVPEG